MISDKAKLKLLKHHGLDAEKDTDSDVDDAIKNSYSAEEIGDMENRARLGDEAQEALIEADLEKHAAKIGAATEHWKDALIANREAALEMLEAIPEPTATATTTATDKGGKKPIHNRAGAGSPEQDLTQPNAEQVKAQKRADAIKNRADTLVKTEGLNPMKAYDKAEAEYDAKA